MRVGMHVGPFSVSSSTRNGGGGGLGLAVAAAVIALVVGWPFVLGNYAWVWVIAVIWWIILALVVVAIVAARKKAAEQAAAEYQQRAREALEQAKRTGSLELPGKTPAYAGVTPSGSVCHHRHRTPEAAAECAARSAKAA